MINSMLTLGGAMKPLHTFDIGYNSNFYLIFDYTGLK